MSVAHGRHEGNSSLSRLSAEDLRTIVAHSRKESAAECRTNFRPSKGSGLLVRRHESSNGAEFISEGQ